MDHKLTIIDRLLDHGVPFRDDKLNNPLHIACKYRVGIIHILLAHQININEVNSRGESPLHIACEHNMIDTVRLLLNHHIDINSVNNDGNSPLFLTSSKEFMMLLLSHGDDMNLQNKLGNNCLHQTVQNKNYKATEALLFLGADLFLPNKHGLMLGDIIHQWNHDPEYKKNYNYEDCYDEFIR